MGRPDFVYVTYLAATPERVWIALTDPAFTARYFGHRVESDWRPGSAFRCLRPDGGVDSEGDVLAVDPPRRLSIAWRRAVIKGEVRELPSAVVDFLLEPLGEVVRLTVGETHEEPVDESYLEGGRTGWPVILSRLKTLLETGRTLPPFPAG